VLWGCNAAILQCCDGDGKQKDLNFIGWLEETKISTAEATGILAASKLFEV